MVRQLKQGEILWYAPDHDYGPRNSAFIPFFVVSPAVTTVGTHFLWQQAAKPAIVLMTPLRHPQGGSYAVQLHPPLTLSLPNNAVAMACQLNQASETEILRAPEQYLWLHRRFKTRPPGEQSPPSLEHKRCLGG